MLALVAIVPSAPLLVPELAGPDAHDTAAVREAVREVGDRLGRSATTWIAIGATDPAAGASDFGAYGVPVPVRIDPAAEPTGAMPLSMLIAAWIRGETEAEAPIRVRPVVVEPDASSAQCRELGVRLAIEIAAADEPIGVLVVGDGATALTPRAPGGGERETALALQRRIDSALGTADVEAVGALSADDCAAEGVGGRAPWQVAAALVSASDMEIAAHLRYADAPFGVGYTVAVWSPGR